MLAGRLQKKNDYFYIVLSFKDQTGKRKEQWIKTGLKVRGNKQKAEEMLYKYRENYDITTQRLKGEQEAIKTKDDPADVLFGDYLEEWVEDIKNTIELTTYSGYKLTIRGRIAPYFNSRGITLKNLTPHILNEYYSAMLKEVSANTVIHFHAYIRKALQDAYINDLIPCNYADKAHRPKRGEFISNYYNRDELLMLFEYVKGTPIEFAVLMASYYGMRRSEIIGLKWSCVDFTYKTITIKHTVACVTIDGKETRIAKDRAKTKKSIRTLPLVQPVEDMLNKMKKMEEANKKFFGHDYCYEDDAYIYKNEHGKLISPSYVTSTFAFRMKRCPYLERIRFHDLRHSCAALLRHQGVPMEDIQKWLEHSQITTTESIYAHFEDKTHLKSAQKILNAFNGQDD